MPAYVRLASLGPGTIDTPSLVNAGLIPAFQRGVNVYVRNADGSLGALATVYPNHDGSGTPLPMPIQTDSSGQLPGYVASGVPLTFVDTQTTRPIEVDPLGARDIVGSDGFVGGQGSRGLATDVVRDGSRGVNVKATGRQATGGVLAGTGTISGGALAQLTITHPLRPGGFLPQDVGAKVFVLGAGSLLNGAVTMLGVPHVTTIQSVNNSTGVATLALAAAQAVTGARVVWGLDDSAILATADADAQAAGLALEFPAGGYFARSLQSSLRGVGSASVTLYRLPDQTVNGTHYAFGNDQPLLANPQALSPTGTPDEDYSVEGVTLDGLCDPNGWHAAASGTFTVTIAAPGVFTKTAHGLKIGDCVTFTTTGSLPGGLFVGTLYYVIATGFAANTFQVATTLNGSPLTTTGTQSGTHTIRPQAATSWNGLQGSGLELYALKRARTSDLRVQNFPFSGVEQASNRSGSLHGDGTGNAGTQAETGSSGANLKAPQPLSNVTCDGRLEIVNVGFQWGMFGAIDDANQLHADIAAGVSSCQVDDTNGNPAVNLIYYMPGMKIGLGAYGIASGETPQTGAHEVLTVDHTDLTTSPPTVFFAAPTLYAHNAGAPIGAVNHLGDPGFGLIIREPARDVKIGTLIADRCGWGGCSIGQAENFKYDALRVGTVQIDSPRIKRCGVQGAPLMKLGFINDASLGSGSIGDAGGVLYDAAVIGDLVLVLRATEAQRFYSGELINVGLPGAGTMEVASVATAITWHVGIASMTSASATLTSVSGTWVVGEKIQSNWLPANTRVTGPGSQGTVLTNPGTMTVSNAALSTQTAPIQGGDSLVLVQPVAFAHNVADDVFAFCGSSPGLAIQEIGFTNTEGVRATGLKIRHCYDGVQMTQRTNDGAGYSNKEHTLTGIHCKRNIRHGFNHIDSQGVKHLGCIAKENGVDGFTSANPLALLGNHGYVGCEATGNGTSNWALVPGSYEARGNVGLSDTGPSFAHASQHAIAASDGLTPQAIGETFANVRLSDCATIPWGFVGQNDAANNLASGTAYGALAVCVAAGAFTQLALFTSSTAPAGLTDARVAVWNSSGTLLQSSASLTATITAANTLYTVPLGGTVNLTQGQVVYLGVGFVGTTMPTLRGWAGSGILSLTSNIARTKNANGWAGGSALPNIAGTNSVNVFPWLVLLP